MSPGIPIRHQTRTTCVNPAARVTSRPRDVGHVTRELGVAKKLAVGLFTDPAGMHRSSERPNLWLPFGYVRGRSLHGYKNSAVELST